MIKITIYEPFHDHCVGTDTVFAFLPKRCYLTGKRLWLKKIYKQTADYADPNFRYYDDRDKINPEVRYEYRYYDRGAFTMARLKGEV